MDEGRANAGSGGLCGSGSPERAPAKWGGAEAGNVLECLGDSSEELQVAMEELRRQNEELVAARQALEDERQRYRQLFDFAPQAYLVTDPLGSIREANWAAASLLRTRQDHLPGKPLACFVAASGRRAFRLHLSRLHEIDAGPAECTLQIQPRRGVVLPIVATVAPVRDSAGRLIALRWLLGYTATARWAEATSARLAAIVESSHDAIIGMDLQGIVSDWNRGAEVMYGYTAEEMVGRPIAIVAPPERAREAEGLLARIREGEQVTDLETVRARKDGRRFHVSVTMSPIRNAAGAVIGVSTIARDVTARKHAEEERARLLEEAREANAAKDQFLAVLSHELRNPLAPILAGVEVLKRSLPAGGKQRHTLEIVERNARLQARLVDDLLDLSRIARGKISIQCRPVALGQVVSSAVESLRARAQSAGVSLTLRQPPELWVDGDPDRLQQVVINLVANAVKFTPQGGAVRVGVWEQGSAGTPLPVGMALAGSKGGAAPAAGASDDAESQGQGDPAGFPSPVSRPFPTPPHSQMGTARIVVEDNGAGIPEDLLPELFQMFRQGHVNGTRSPGLGIGLALAKSLVEMHGGAIRAESDGPGKGSRFTVEVPLIASPGPGKTASHPAPSDVPYRLLLVEDNADARVLLADSLAAYGYEVAAAASAEEALAQLARVRPEAILSDIDLPGLDGYEFVRRAHRLPGMGAVPAFALTGFGQPGDVRRAREAGFAGHFTKPVDLAELDEQIREHLSGVCRGGRVRG